MIYEFQATQSYNGYDKPWAGGTGKNLFNPDDPDIVTKTNKFINRNNGAESPSDQYNLISGFDVSSYIESNITISPPLSGVASAPGGAFYDEENTYISGFGNPSSYLAVAVPADAKTLAFSIPNTVEYSNVMIELGSERTAYEPYANVCMPEGFNIWDPTNQEYVQVYAGYVNANTRELYLRPVYNEYAGEELVGPWMSSLDEYSEDATPTEGAFVIDFGGELTSYEITPFMLQTLLDSLGIRQHFTDGAGLLNKLMDQAQGRVRSEEELLHLSRPLNVIAIGDQLPAGLTFKPISKDVLPGLPGKFIR